MCNTSTDIGPIMVKMANQLKDLSTIAREHGTYIRQLQEVVITLTEEVAELKKSRPETNRQGV